MIFECELIAKKNHILYKVTDSLGNVVHSNISLRRAIEILEEFFYDI